MAELAAASSVGGLLSLTIQVIQISQRYISGVRNASKTIRSYFRELEIMRLVLEDFQSFIGSNAGSPASWTAFQACSDELECLKSKLCKRMDSSSSTNRLNRLSWPFAEDETRRVTEVLHRYQSSLHMLLTAQSHRIAASTLAAIDKVEARQEQESKERIVQWFSQADPLDNYTAARDKHEPSTGDWFLRSDEFITWKSNPNTNMWIRSIAGAGKTILSSTVVEDLMQNQEAGDFILFYYFDFQNERKQKLRSLLLSLIAQICVRADHVPQNIQEVFRKGALFDSHSLKDMFTALALDCGHVKIVVDALDESSERLQLLEFLEDLANNFSGPVQWLVTSRSEQDIEASLIRCTPITVSLDKTVMNDDIRLHIESCLIQDPVLRRRPAWVKQRISETVISKADGMYASPLHIFHDSTARYYLPASDLSRWFQYVVCQLSVLRACLTGPAVEAALIHLPAGIDETYDRMLLSVNVANCEQVRRALLIITFSVRPVRVEEVAEFAVICGRSKPFDPGDRLFESKDIVGLAAGLIVYDEATDSLILAHYSVKEYLLSSRITSGPARYFALDEKAADQYITQASVMYMLSVADLTVGYHGITQDYPFLQYAGAHWVQHARPSHRDAFTSNIELVLHMLDGRNGAYKFWLAYHDPASENRTPLESLCARMHGSQLLDILKNTGFLHLPVDILVRELCALFTRTELSNRSIISVQATIDAKAEMLKILRGLSSPRSRFIRLKMLKYVCMMDAGDSSPDWQPLNEAIYLALFEPLDSIRQGNLPEKFTMEEVEHEVEWLQSHTATLEGHTIHEHRFSHVLDYIKQRISQEQIEADSPKGTAAGNAPRLMDLRVEAGPATPLRESVSSEHHSKQEQGDGSP